MKLQKVKGIVVKENNTNEADKILTVITESIGKIKIYAKGARRPRNSFIMSTQLLCYSDFILFKGKDMYYISSADLIKPFYSIREDIKKLVYSSHILELCLDGVQENQYSGEILKLLLNTLHMIESSKNKPYDLIISIFELKFISLIGFTPELTKCTKCGQTSFENLYFNPQTNGIICEKCYTIPSKQILISFGTYKAMLFILNSKINDLFRISLGLNLISELKKVTTKYTNFVMEKEYKKLAMLDELS